LGALKKKKNRGPWARAQCAHWLRRPWISSWYFVKPLVYLAAHFSFAPTPYRFCREIVASLSVSGGLIAQIKMNRVNRFMTISGQHVWALPHMPEVRGRGRRSLQSLIELRHPWSLLRQNLYLYLSPLTIRHAG